MTTELQPSEAITRSWGNKINHKINTSSVLLQVLVRVRIRVRVRVRVRVRGHRAGLPDRFYNTFLGLKDEKIF